MQQGAHDDDELLLPAGERGKVLAELIGETDRCGKGVDALASCAHGHAPEGMGEIEQVLAHAEAKVGRALRVLPGVANRAAHLLLIAPDVIAADLGVAAGGPQQCCQDAHQGGLARAVRSEQAKHLAGVHGKVQRSEGLHGGLVTATPGVGLVKRLRLYRELGVHQAPVLFAAKSTFFATKINSPG